MREAYVVGRVVRRCETVPKLILVNGPPGVGKSTVARRYVDDHPLTLDLEIDAIRAMIGSWLEAADRSGLAARRVALAAAVTHLQAGYDVIVPQLLTRREFVEELRGAAESVGATFHEVTLVDDRATVLAPATHRPEPARQLQRPCARREARQVA
jgi:predicted kinase